MLEVAYWIGRTPGVTPGAQEEAGFQLSQYRDPDNTHQINGVTRRDNWVVFHLHFDPSDNRRLFRRVTVSDGTEQIQIGTFSMRMFHGQTADMRYGGNNRRVANRATGSGGENTRSPAYTCPPRTVWYMGELTGAFPAWNPSDPGTRYEMMLRWFAAHLRVQHVLDDGGLNRAWTADNWRNNNFANNQRPQPRSTDSNGAPYRDSQVWDQTMNDGRGGYNTNPNIPQFPDGA